MCGRAACFLQLGIAPDATLTLQGHTKKVCLTLDALAKSMLADDGFDLLDYGRDSPACFTRCAAICLLALAAWCR